MKQVLFILLVLVSIRVFSQDTIKIVKIDSLEVMKTDLGKMRWTEAKKVMDELGNGWRFPTIEEFKVLYKYRDSIGGFKNYYWSTESDYTFAWNFDFVSKETAKDIKNNYNFYVRAVRDIKSSSNVKTAEKPTLSGLTETIKIGSLEIMKTDLPKMTWDEAKKKVAELGDRWRLPTIEELKILHENIDLIGIIEDDLYWSSTEGGSTSVWVFYFGFGKKTNNRKDNVYCVRAVRDLK